MYKYIHRGSNIGKSRWIETASDKESLFLLNKDTILLSKGQISMDKEGGPKSPLTVNPHPCRPSWLHTELSTRTLDSRK
jgi:hypothetical protein